MKKLIPIVLFTLLIACQPKAVENTVTDQEAPVSIEEASFGVFGGDLTESEVVGLSDALADLGEGEIAIKTTGSIEKVCQSKGCWMVINDGQAKEVRVTFKDYGFFVPKNAMGNTATVEGILKKEVTSVEDLRHFAKDEGKSVAEIEEITEPEESYSFIADAVVIEK